MMTSPLPLHRLTAFLSQGSTAQTPSPLQLHLLRGWKESTLLSYDSAVRKFRKFLVESGQDTWILPASPEDFYNFCFWAGRTEAEDKAQEITLRKVKKYLFGLQAWHTFHDQPYPTVTKSRVVVLLRACSRQDALRPERPLKSPVIVNHLLLLYHSWVEGSEEDRTSLDCVLVAFWGMARLAEVTYDNRTGQPPWLNSLLCEDVVQSTPRCSNVTLNVRGAKTAKAGIPQPILLKTQPNVLCPVAAVRRCLTRMHSEKDALFGHGDMPRFNLTRSRLVNKCAQVWVANGSLGLSGHSFRVGGASLRAALGVPHDEIKQLGRWESDCYKLYLREYSGEDLSMTTSLIRYINGQS